MKFILTLLLAVTLLSSVSNARTQLLNGTYACGDWVEGYQPLVGKYSGVTLDGTMSIATVTKGKIVLSRTNHSKKSITLTQIFPNGQYMGSARWYAHLDKEKTKHEMYSVHDAKIDYAAAHGCEKYDLCIIEHSTWGRFYLTKCMMQ